MENVTLTPREQTRLLQVLNSLLAEHMTLGLEEAMGPGGSGPLRDVWIRGHVGEYEHRNDMHPAAELAVDGVTEAEGGAQGDRQRRIPAPQTVDGVLTTPDLEGDAGPSLEPDGEVDLRGGEGGLASWTT